MDHDDFDQEPIRGLPEMLPEGEEILWQGRPDWWALTVSSLSLKWVAGYFVLLFGWSAVVKAAEMSAAAAIGQSSFYLVLGAGVCLLLMAIGWAQAKSAVYTVTNRRVVMRIGAALTMTLQFPFQWIGAADLTMQPGGTGTIALRTLGKTKFSYLLLWPHLRPWRFAPTQPALRCIPDAARVAALMAAAVTDERMPQPLPQVTDTPDLMPIPAE